MTSKSSQNRLPILAILLVLLVVGVSTILVGTHDIDNSFNLLYFQQSSGVFNWTDSSMLGLVNTAPQLYNLGVMLIFIGMIIIVISAFELGRHINAR